MSSDRPGLKILVADDMTANRLMIGAMLRALPYEITIAEAGDGVAVMRLFNANRPDIIILDLEMPKMSGLVAATEIRKIDKDIPIAVISGKVNDKVAEYLRSINIKNILTKPVISAELRQVIVAFAPAQSKSVSIMIADDSKTVREMLASLCALKPLDIALTMADDGEKALIEFRKKPFHMVFLDVNMPKIDGINVLKKMKMMNAAAKVIMITGDRTETTIRAAVDCGASGYVVKPFTQDQIHSALRKLL